MKNDSLTHAEKGDESGFQRADGENRPLGAGLALEEQRLVEELLRRGRRKTLSDITSGIAHHLNNALTPILGNAELLLRRRLDAESERMLREIVERSLQARRLIQRLQELSAPPVNGQKESVDINKLLQTLVEATEPWWNDNLRRDGRNVEVILELGAARPIYGDTVALREAFLQLLINAVEAIPSQGRVEIRTESSATEARIMIMDNGVGIPEKIQERIFEPFLTTKGPQRAGLGLSTVQTVIADHGGAVEIFSQEGAGTSVIVTLPLPVSAAEPQDAVRGLIISAEEALPAYHVLVIEDEEPVRQLLTTILEKEGQRVMAVASGQEGLAAFRKRNYPVVFTDWGMDGISGLQVAQKIKEIAPGTRVILVTGWSSQLDRKRAGEWGVDAILAKPFTIEQVRRRLRALLSNRE